MYRYVGLPESSDESSSAGLEVVCSMANSRLSNLGTCPADIHGALKVAWYHALHPAFDVVHICPAELPTYGLLMPPNPWMATFKVFKVFKVWGAPL
jgi:hypothetical protein